MHSSECFKYPCKRVFIFFVLILNDRSVIIITMKHDPKKIYDFLRDNSRMPSYAEVSHIYNFKSKNAAFILIQKFIDKGLLLKDNRGKLLPVNIKNGLLLLGSIQAGFPGAGEEILHQSISLDEWVVQDPEASYLLQVEGDSMIDAGIHKGDYVVVEMVKDFKDGMIVVAEIDGEWTLKYLRSQKGVQYLEAANKNYPDLFPENELVLHAKVVSVVRKYE